ncbi:MAG: hypothetical protein V8S34_05285 [Lawsonibacter sp.]
MKFLQKTWVAVVITAAMIVAAVAIGLSKPAPAVTPEPCGPRHQCQRRHRSGHHPVHRAVSALSQ